MKYELLLQAPPGEPFDEAPVLQAAGARHPLSPEAPQRWTLPAGEVEIHPLREAGRIVALEVHVPLAESDKLLRAAVQASAEVARETGRVLYDPQLNRPLVAADEDAAAAQFERTSRYVADMVGVPGLTGMGISTEPPRMKVSVKVALALVGFVLLLLFLSNTLTRALMTKR